MVDRSLTYQILTSKSFLERITSLRLLPVFFLIPAAIILQRTFSLNWLPTQLLLGNNTLFLLFLIARLMVVVRGRSVAAPCPPPRERDHLQFSLSPDSVRDLARLSGYVFSPDGVSGIYRPRRARYASILSHVGLILLLAVGTFDNLREFTGVLFLGGGEPFALYDPKTYGVWSKGLLSSYDSIDFKIQHKGRFLPSPEHPRGAVEVALLNRKGGKLWQGIITPDSPHRQGGYDFKMVCFIYDIWFVITTVTDHLVNTDWVRFHPLREPLENFTHTGEVKDDFHKVFGRAWFDERTDRVRLDLKHKGVPIRVELGEAPEHRKVVDGYLVKNEGIGRWTQIHVLRHRHVPLMVVGCVLFVVGILLRLFSPPRRLWVEPVAEGCQVITRDRRLLSVLTGQEADTARPPEDVS